MKIRSAVLAGVGVIALVIIIGIVSETNKQTSENTIRVAFFPNIGHAIPIVGLERGIFEDNFGNSTTIERKLFDSGPQVIETLFAKSIDLAYVGPGPAINGFLKSENHDVVILSGAATGGASFIVHPNSQINSVDDFAGKRIAAPQIGNSQDVSLRNYLSENGLKPYQKGGTVIVLNIPNPDIYTLFTKGEIDAAWIPEPWATILVQELNGKRLFYEEELWPENKFASVLLIGRQEYVVANPEVVVTWLESHQQTVNWINDHPQETRIIFNQFMQNTLGQTLSDSVVDEALGNLVITTDSVNDSIYTFAQRADSLGYLGRDGYTLDGIFFDKTTNESLGGNN
ncbi:MAG: ABC transporter substrate-binding protein [Thaumarchaeota archaeon]|nr:ABC transporter substrate-binding protein [Nitrososphaerota archaeon]